MEELDHKGKGFCKKIIPKGYIGSVRFYKNLILLVVIAAIAAPTVIAARLGQEVAAIEALPPTVPDSTVDIAAMNAEVLDYQQMLPDFYAPEPYQATERPSRTVYLTFEGTPPEHTQQLLDALQEAGIKATFFVTGRESEETLQAIAAQGHTLGMLSWSGDHLSIYRSVEAYLTDMEKVYRHIKEATGTAPAVFRFLGGSINSYNAAIYHQLIAEMVRRGFVGYDWNIRVEKQACQQDGDIAVQEIVSALRTMDRAVIALPSDGADLTSRLIPRLMEELDDQGYAMAALDAAVKPVSFAYPA